MIQFSATAYSPRLVLWISRDPFMWHAVGIFTLRHCGAGMAGPERLRKGPAYQ
jgi:hypothetical protein